MQTQPTLGTSLRHLVELLDNGVQENYDACGIDYRPRYTPVVRALIEHGPSSIRAISTYAGISHSAASQTVAGMAAKRLVTLAIGRDVRERIVTPTARLREMIPTIQSCWLAVNRAADALDKELSAPLSSVVRQAIAALEAQPYFSRISDQAKKTAPALRRGKSHGA